MNRRYSALALSALAMCAAALTATEASATPEDQGLEVSNCPATKRSEYNYPNYDPRCEVPPVSAAFDGSALDDSGAEALQAGASALGGAGITLGGIWLYRRRHQLAT